MYFFRKGFILLRGPVAGFDKQISRRWINYQYKHPKYDFNEDTVVQFQEKLYEIPKKNRTKENFLAAIEFFRSSRGSRGRGHVEFINAALRSLKDFGIHKDIDTYKALLNVFPKGVMIPRNVWQKIFMHYPVQQVCCVDILDEMEYHGVRVDKEIHDIVVHTFGQFSFAGKKAKRMMYWLPKLRHTNSFIDRRLVEDKNLTEFELARLALKMMCRDAGTIITNVNVRKPGIAEIFDDWIISAQSPLQKQMMRDFPIESTSFYIDGPRFVYVMDKRIEYGMLTASPLKSIAIEEFIDQRTMQEYGEDLHEKIFDTTPDANIHEQKDETILAMCVLESYTPRMASAWLNHLLEKNPSLERANVLIRIHEEERGLQSLANQHTF